MGKLVLVEGLNGAGKTTWIQKQTEVHNAVYPGITHPKSVCTTWLNPIRDVENTLLELSEFQHIKQQFSSSVTLSYITIAHMMKYIVPDVYQDRSWISAFVYGSIVDRDYNLLLKKYREILGDDFKVVYIQTPIEICKKRMEDKPYVNKDMNWDLIECEFNAVMSNLHLHGIKVEFEKGY